MTTKTQPAPALPQRRLIAMQMENSKIIRCDSPATAAEVMRRLDDYAALTRRHEEAVRALERLVKAVNEDMADGIGRKVVMYELQNANDNASALLARGLLPTGGGAA